jgi:hypothetical protein
VGNSEKKLPRSGFVQYEFIWTPFKIAMCSEINPKFDGVQTTDFCHNLEFGKISTFKLIENNLRKQNLRTLIKTDEF